MLRSQAHHPQRQMAVPLIRRNYLLAIANGAIVHMGMRMVDPVTVISLLVLRLSGLNWIIGLTTALVQAARVSVQVIAARYLDTMPRKRPQYIVATVVRVLALLAAGMLLIYGKFLRFAWLLVFLELALVALSAGMGVAGLVWSDVVAKSVPTTKRGSLVMYRFVCGLSLAQLVAVPVVRLVLGPESGLGFPANYGVLFIISAIVRAIAWVTFFFVDEPPSQAQRHRLTLLQHLFRGPRLLRRDRDYRRLLIVQLLSASAAAGGGFYIALARTEWGLPDRYAAYFMTAQIIAGIVSAIALGRISDLYGNRLVILLARGAALVSTVAAAIAALAPPQGALQLAGHVIPTKHLVLALAFAGHGFVMYGGFVGEFNYMLDIAPPSRRPSYLGFAGLFLLPVSFVPMVMGFLADWGSYGLVFGICVALALASLAASRKLEEPREELEEVFPNAAK